MKNPPGSQHKPWGVTRSHVEGCGITPIWACVRLYTTDRSSGDFVRVICLPEPDGWNITGTLRELVCGAGLDSAAAPACHASRSARRGECIADRAYRRRQD